MMLGLSIPSAALWRRGSAFPSDELLLNGGMDNDSVWVHGTPPVIAGGVMTWSGTLGNANQTPLVPFVPGATYEVAFEVTAYSAGGIQMLFVGGVERQGTIRSSVGVFVEPLIANAGNNLFLITASTAPNLSIDNVSLVRIA